MSVLITLISHLHNFKLDMIFRKLLSYTIIKYHLKIIYILKQS